MMDPGTVRFARSTRHGRWMNPVGRPGLASIIIPTYNRAPLLGEAIASAQGQTYRPIEILVVDDGSTDETPAVLGHWQEKLRGDPAISFRVFRQVNSGASAAINLGLIESRGEFIQFLDSDDILFPEKVRLQIACLERHPEAGLAFSQSVNLVPEQGESRQSELPPSVESAILVQSADYYCQNDILRIHGVYRRQTCRDAGPSSEDLKLSEDREYNFRILLVNDRIVRLPGKLSARRVHSAGRLTDVYCQPVGLRIRLRGLNMMADLARSENCLQNRKLISLLTRRYTRLVMDALERGDSEIAIAAARSCKALPIYLSRRLKLTAYELLSLFPSPVYRRWAPLWPYLRGALLRLPGRHSTAAGS
jgi:glycosyltransferase involved in cell wall biosynthesis